MIGAAPKRRLLARNDPHCDAGFTLIEMLVSLLILGIVAAMLLQGLQTVGRFGPRSIQMLEADESIAAGQRILTDRLRQLRPVVDRNSVNPIIDALGDERSFSFIAPPPANAEPDSLWRYRIATTPAGELNLFTINTLDERQNSGDVNGRNWRTRKVIDNVQAIRINYYGPKPVGSGSGWQTAWRQRPQPPALVRISVIFRDGDRRGWPDLIVRPRATDNTACKIDALTGRCGGVS